MPLINNNPIYGMDNKLDVVPYSSDECITKYHESFLLGKNNPWILLNCGMDPLQTVDENGNINILSEPFIFQVKIQFVVDDENDNQYMIQYSGGVDETTGVDIIYVSLINWNIGDSPGVVDIITDKKEIIDCGNGISLLMQMRLYNTPTSDWYIIDFYLCSKIMDVEVYNNTYNLNNEEDQIDNKQEDNIVQMKDYKELMNDVIRDSDNDAIYNRDDYDDGSDETLND